MPADRAEPGWPWADVETTPAGDPALAEAFAACFSGMAGRIVLEHLRRVFLERRVPPTASDAELRHVEGQRSAIAWLLAMAAPERLSR